MATGLVTWSQTAASNATADSTVNFAEGQAPASLNDSNRALMASAAKWRDDNNGSLATTGTSTAYALTSNQNFAALTAGYSVCFTPNTTNGDTVTLNVDSLGAKPLRSAPGVELFAGTLVEGTPYVATYYTSNSGEWILRDFYGNPYSIPLGGMMPYIGSTAPNSAFVLPYGQAISRTTYATLFSLVGTTYGTGNGSTTFNVPDLRGRTVFGLDNLGGSAASRITAAGGNFDATVLGATGGGQNQTLTTAQVPTGIITFNDNNHSHRYVQDGHGIVGVFVSTSDNSTGTLQSGGAIGTALSSNTESVTTGASITDNAGGGSHPIIPPSIILPFILRVL